MTYPLRITFWIVGVLVGLVLVAGLVSIWIIRRPFPDARGAVALPGVSAPVEILRDERGIPHIWAQSRADLYFAQGYVEAQDRFWQMEFQRRVGAGRLSELLGEGTVASDRYLRTMGFRRTAEQEYTRLDEPFRTYAEAYAAGVNAYISERSPEQLGLEFTLLSLTGVDVTVEPWTPVDSLSWGKVMAETLSAGFSSELSNVVFRRYGGELLHRALRTPFRDAYPTIATMEEIRDTREQLGLSPLPETSTHRPRVDGRGIGSNSWVISGERTTTGAPILANDMHLGFQMPSIWYEIGLHVRDGDEELHLRGYTFPGVPGVIAGQNEHIAWGITNLGGDAKNSYNVRVDPEDPTRYFAAGRWREMEVRYELIGVAGKEEAVEHRVRETVFGPIVSDLPQFSDWFSYEIEPEESDAPVGIHELALNWSALEPEGLFLAVMRLNEAANYAEFRDALSQWGSPGQNLIYADREGTIAYQATGVYPAQSLEEGRLPKDADALPPEPVRFDLLPAVLNPEKGFIVTANQPVVPPEHPYPLAEEGYGSGRRAARIVELILEAGRSIDVEAIRGIHGDVYSIPASELVPHLTRIDAEEALEAWMAYRESRGTGATSEEQADVRERMERLVPAALTHLGAWEYEMNAESAAAAVYAFVFEAVTERVFRDEVPSFAWPLISHGTAESAVTELLNEPDNPLWDDRVTLERERASDILARSLAAGVYRLSQEQGDDPASWEWGNSHSLTLENQSLGQSGIGIVERLLNRGPFPIDGGPTTVSPAGWNAIEPFEVTFGVSQRAIYDLADPSNSRFIHPTGQSGHAFHRHYDDMVEPYLNLEYHRSNWTYEEAREAAGGRRLVLEPEG